MKKYEIRANKRIEEIKKIKWFKPTTKPDEKKLLPQVRKIYKAFKIDMGLKLEIRTLENKNDWDAARSAAWDAAWSTAWDAARSAAWSAAWDAARSAARSAARDAAWSTAWDAAWSTARSATRSAARDAAWDAAWSASWEIFSDLLKKKGWKANPFHELIKLWAQGFYVCGIVKGKFLLYYVPKK